MTTTGFVGTVAADDNDDVAADFEPRKFLRREPWEREEGGRYWWQSLLVETRLRQRFLFYCFVWVKQCSEMIWGIQPCQILAAGAAAEGENYFEKSFVHIFDDAAAPVAVDAAPDSSIAVAADGRTREGQRGWHC